MKTCLKTIIILNIFAVFATDNNIPCHMGFSANGSFPIY